MSLTNGSEYITVQGRQIPLTRMMIPVEDLELDSKNPRIQYLLGLKAGLISDEQLDEMLWEKDRVKQLSQSILQNLGVLEPIIVQRAGKKYRVREGNLRTVATRHLVEQHPEIANLRRLPAVVFDGTLTEEDLAVLLADMHVAGKIRWDAYEQAKHVHDLFNIYGKPYEWLSNHLRMSKGKIRELLTGYKATSDFLQEHPGPENVRKYSFFAELQKKKELRERFDNDPHFRKNFYRWLIDGKLTDARQVRSLESILNNAAAEQELDKNGYEAASKVLVREDPTLESDLFWAVKNATERLKSTPASDIQDLKAGNPQKIILLRNLHRAIEDLATLASVKL